MTAAREEIHATWSFLTVIHWRIDEHSVGCQDVE
jgi:hypothetical protein